MGFFWGVLDEDYRGRTFWTNKNFDDVRKKNWPKTGRIFTVCSGPASQSIRRGRLNCEGALDVRENRERRDKIVLIFSPEKQKKRNFGLNFPLFWAGSLVVRKSQHRRDRISDKNSRKRREKYLGLRIFLQKRVRIPWNFYFIFLVTEKLTSFGGGYNFKTG